MTATVNSNLKIKSAGVSKGAGAAILLLAGACLVWSGEFLLLEIVLAYLPAACCNVLRLGAGAAALLVVSRLRGGRVKLAARDNLRLWLGGLTLAGYYYLENLGVAATSGVTASMLLALIPIVGLAADRIFFGHAVTGKKALASLVSIGGILLIVGGEGDGGGSLSGSLFMLGAVIMWVAYMTLAKPLLGKYPATLLVSRLLLSACLCSLPLALPELPATASCPWQLLLLAALTGMCCTAGADILYLTALSRVSLSLAAMAENLIPVTTVLLSFVVFGRLPALTQLLGGAVILAAVLLSSKPGQGEPSVKLSRHSHVCPNKSTQGGYCDEKDCDAYGDNAAGRGPVPVCLRPKPAAKIGANPAGAAAPG